jgi:dihydrofolate reductase
VIFESISLDGVYQAPGRADEDTRDGFGHGGWAVPYSDEETGRAAGASMAGTGALLFGRRTYVDFVAVWPGRTDNPFSAILDNSRKYVVSRTLSTVDWQNSTLLSTLDDVVALKERPGKDIVVLGSGELVRGLLGRGLVDELVLLVHPVLLGSGRRLFPGRDRPVPLNLVASQTTRSGVVVATYQWAA